MGASHSPCRSFPFPQTSHALKGHVSMSPLESPGSEPSDGARSRNEAAEYFGRVAKKRDWRNSLRTQGLSINSATLWGFSMKYVSLALLVFQNSALIVTMHYSRVVPVVPGHRYLPSTAVLLVEVLKLVVSLSVALYQLPEYRHSGPSSKLVMSLYASIFSSDSWKLVIPAALYTLQNSLVYIAIGNLSAASFQVTYQLKILTTVLFSIILLGKRITSKQWLALVLLTIGVAIVQTGGELPASMGSLADIKTRISMLLLPSQNGPSDAVAETSRLAESLASRLQKPGLDSGGNKVSLVGPIMDASKGLLAVVGASLTSGLTGVYFEKVIKDSLSSVSLWTRNVQLSFFSLFPALIIGVWWQDGREISSNGFFVGYNWIVWTTIALQAFGGIMVAVCITYADNIAKNFAASFSIVVSCVLSAIFFESPLTLNFTMGTAIVLLAVYLYQSRDRAPKRLILPLTTPGGAINLR